MEHRRTIARLTRLAEAAQRAVDRPAPCYAHIRVLTERRARDVLLGPHTAITPDVTIVDWQRAPLASVLFGYREGADYEIEQGDRTLTGQLVERHLLRFDRGALTEIITPDALLQRDGDDWVASARTDRALVTRRAPADRARDHATGPVLDADQQRAVERPAGTSLLVLGEAGFGKTTVALHRLAWLRERADEAGVALAALVLVPTEGLRRLSVLLLDRLGVPGVVVKTVDQWLAEQARAVFAGLPERTSEASAAVIRFKRHPAVRAVLSDLAAARPGRRVGRTELLHLFGDRALLDRIGEVAAASGRPVSGHVIQTVLEHTVVQFRYTTEQAHAHVDADRLKTVDGRAIDDGTPMQDADTIDAEDFAVLFELNRVKTGRDRTARGALARYDHIVIDEAQELAPMELAVIGRAVTAGGAITVAGDEQQQVDDTAYFTSWQATMAELGRGAHEPITLARSYRCPAEVTAFAQGLVDRGPSDPEIAGDGSRLLCWRFDNECHLAVELIDQLAGVTSDDPRATLAVICRTPQAAERLDRNLGRGIPTRLALHGEIDFEPGVIVTCVAEVKGLEFDYVIVPDASAASYPDTRASRHALYVAVTRAIHHVWLASPGPWSALVPDSLRNARPGDIQDDMHIAES